jgi:hypothetical protein
MCLRISQIGAGQGAVHAPVVVDPVNGFYPQKLYGVEYDKEGEEEKVLSPAPVVLEDRHKTSLSETARCIFFCFPLYTVIRYLTNKNVSIAPILKIFENFI